MSSIFPRKVPISCSVTALRTAVLEGAHPMYLQQPGRVASQDCWEPCGKKAGYCSDFCGRGNACRDLGMHQQMHQHGWVHSVFRLSEDRRYRRPDGVHECPQLSMTGLGSVARHIQVSTLIEAGGVGLCGRLTFHRWATKVYSFYTPHYECIKPTAGSFWGMPLQFEFG